MQFLGPVAARPDVAADHRRRRSRATTTRLGLTHVRTVARELDVPLAGAEPDEVEHVLTRERWAAT